MLSPETIRIVKQTVPVLQEHGERIAKHFYERMFTRHPEVIPFFSQTEQAREHQQKALARAVCAYAMNIDNLGALESAVEHISRRHVSAHVKAEHYTIVGENFLATIKEVLGDAATVEILQAWEEAYNVLAYIFIQKEGQLYKSQRTAWQGLRPFSVKEKVRECAQVVSLHLAPCDRIPLPLFKPGQYVTVQFFHQGQTIERPYSVSSKPGESFLRITIKCDAAHTREKEDAHLSHIIDNLKPEDVVQVTPPSGDFVLDDQDNPLIFLAAGVGVAPFMSMILHAQQKQPQRSIKLVYAAKSKDAQPFREALNALSAASSMLHTFYVYSDIALYEDAPKYEYFGRISRSFFEKNDLVDHKSTYYCCGPRSFIHDMQNILADLHIDPKRIIVDIVSTKGG